MKRKEKKREGKGRVSREAVRKGDGRSAVRFEPTYLGWAGHEAENLIPVFL